MKARKAPGVNAAAWRVSAHDRFGRLVDRRGTDECWPWTGSKNRKGYGNFSYAKSVWSAHRVAWTLVLGPIPSGLCVLHRCDNPPCCNPAHLFLGTKAENTHDMVAKGRQARGTSLSKLSTEAVLEVVALGKAGHRHIDVAARFGIARQTVSDILSGRRWRHLTGLSGLGRAR